MMVGLVYTISRSDDADYDYDDYGSVMTYQSKLLALLSLLAGLAGGHSLVVDSLLLSSLEAAGVLLANLHADHAEEEKAAQGVAGSKDADSLDLLVHSRRDLGGRGDGEERPRRLGVREERAERVDVHREVEDDRGEVEDWVG
jgi:hypothetical protein